MEILMHICCAPCATYSTRHFRELGYQVRGFFYNPNIHPYPEYQKRLDTLRDYCGKENIPLSVNNGYDHEGYLRQVLDGQEGRCRCCYRLRLEETAREAARLGIQLFTSTLAISPYQDHELLRLEGEVAGRRYGVRFVYEDLRPGYRESVEESRRLGLYRQGYCGCLFSEWERYAKKSGRITDA